MAAALAVPQHEPDRMRRAAQLIVDAIERMPLLAARYAVELDRLTAFATTDAESD